jgi:hypothetical protein
MTRTVANHFSDVTKDSRVVRPYMGSAQVVREIMEGSGRSWTREGLLGQSGGTLQVP